ncbi:TerC family protein [Brevibacterium ravenspurgense]|uniref:TerC family protein n=1 Tax=Brevibacterium ravenspurgense TaxID=479117 RepID=UPI00031CF663|nr:TerC family protein [Brevibacterium ravenspurgense]
MHHESASGLSLTFEFIVLGVLCALLLADLLLILKRPHRPSNREAGLWVGFYVALALIFAGVLYLFGNKQASGEFLAGWLMEYSLSIDNVFVFIIVLSAFKVPPRYQQEVLMVGIIISLVFRGIFILAGVWIIEKFIWVFFIFGAFLLWTAWKQATEKDDDGGGDNLLVRMVKKRFPFTDDYHDNKIFVKIDGKRFATPMLLVFIAIGTTDVMFALDSIPAIMAVTRSAFIIFTANLFALMGLRQLYFLLENMADKLQYLKYGIAVILGYIGFKLIYTAARETFAHQLPEIPLALSLGVIVVSMAVAVIASLVKRKRDYRHFRSEHLGS